MLFFISCNITTKAQNGPHEMPVKKCRVPNLVEVDLEGKRSVGGVGEERDEGGRGGGGGGRGRRLGRGGGGGEEVEVGEEAVGPAAGGAAGECVRLWRWRPAARAREGEGERRGVWAREEVVEALHCRRRGARRGLGAGEGKRVCIVLFLLLPCVLSPCWAVQSAVALMSMILDFSYKFHVSKNLEDKPNL